MTSSPDRATAPAGNPGSQKDEFAALTTGCGIFDLSARAKISLSGSDRVRWLNGIVTNNVRDLAPGLGVYAFLLNPQGHILADLYVYNRGESLLVDIDRPLLEKVLAHFDHYIIMDDVTVDDVSDRFTAIGVAGPKSGDVLQAAGIALPALQPLQFDDFAWREFKLTAVRADNPAVESYQFLAPPEAFPALWDALVKAGGKVCGPDALELFRIASGVPRYGTDIRERDLPQETAQDRALHFVKGCYIGQEIVERIRSRGSVHRTFQGFKVTGPLPAAGAKIQAEGKDVGEITSAALLPLENGPLAVALGYVRREASAKPLMAGETSLVTASLPFQEIISH